MNIEGRSSINLFPHNYVKGDISKAGVSYKPTVTIYKEILNIVVIGDRAKSRTNKLAFSARKETEEYL